MKKVAELEGDDLDAVVAKAEGWAFTDPETITTYPSRDWSIGGPIIEREQIFIEPPHDVHALNLDAEGNPKGVWTSFETWHATVSARTRRWNKGPNDPATLVGGRVGRGEGPTPLIAAMRAYVESVFGDEIGEVTPEIPETDSLGG